MTDKNRFVIIVLLLLITVPAFGESQDEWIADAQFIGGFGTIVCVQKEHAYQVPYAPICDAKEPTIEWIGLVAVGNEDRYYGNVGWLSDIQIGLRSDGVLVWRIKPKRGEK